MMDVENIRVKPVWPRSKEVVWAEVFEHIDEQKGKKVFLRRLPVWSYAASLLIPVLLICQFYTVTKDAVRGEHAVVQLPDRTTVTLNAESRLSYKPLAWYFARKVNLEGEACFEVKNGSRFSVYSGNNRVSVLGTTFNVYARFEAYRVTCLTGQVEVCAGQETVVLNPNMQATYRERKISVNSDVALSNVTGWVQGKFVFDKTPLQEVIAEVERQYNINIVPAGYDPKHLYTGYFSKNDNSPEEIIEIIGKAFGIIFSIR
jgi:ferric-dicitrate binding protein FerR (iron transport regulator)